MFTYWHENPPPAFNPDYIEWAKDISTLATYDCEINNVYISTDMDYRKSEWRKYYDARMKQGKPSKLLVKKAKEYLYEL